MKFRMICLGIVALVLTASGCLPYSRHPCWGFRFHPCQNRGNGMCDPCAPAGSSPIHHPLLHRHKMRIASDCSACIGGAVAGMPTMSYPTVIGQPTPLHGPTVIPSSDLPMPNPMPPKPTSGY
jgi:hypothetical protein